jgi:lipoprotein-anchoring transpeptidase ErfK/SrfK
VLPDCGGEHPGALCGTSVPGADETPSARTRDPQNAFEKTARLHRADGPDAVPDAERAPTTDPIPRAAASGSLQAKPVAVTSRHPKGTILVRVQAKKLYFYRDTGTAYEFRIGTARPGIQFYGRTRVTAKRRNPTWIPTRNQRKLYGNLPASVPPGPKNPLGTRALNLAQGNLRIHGTNEPDTIGKAVSDGCIRLDNADIERLFELVSIGARVIVER